MMRNITRILPLALLTMLLPLAASAQSPTPHRHGGETPPAAEGKMAGCEAMMARHQEMQQRMKTMDAELDQLVAAMQSATGDDKLVATAAVVEALVEQRKSMHGMMMKHQPEMMQHMMQHMGGGEGMGDCPMMKKMHAADDAEAAAEDHSAHHPD
jgi:hypothetical protein